VIRKYCDSSDCEVQLFLSLVLHGVFLRRANGHVWMLVHGESLQMETEMLVLLKLYGHQ